MSVSPTQTLSPSGSRSGSDSCIPSTQASASLSAGATKYLLTDDTSSKAGPSLGEQPAYGSSVVLPASPELFAEIFAEAG